MTLTGKHALDLMESIRKRETQKEAELLAKMKAEAARRGKEPFDLATLAKYTETSDQGSLPTPEEQQVSWERAYYVGYAEVMTIEEFATHVKELGRWSGG